MTTLVVTTDTGKRDDMILRPAKFFCCVNACTHGNRPRNWYGERYKPVVLPPRGAVLDTEKRRNKCLSLSS